MTQKFQLLVKALQGNCQIFG